MVQASAAKLTSGAVHWLPEYGCAVLALNEDNTVTSTSLRLGYAKVYVVGADNWEHRLHRCVTGISTDCCIATLALLRVQPVLHCVRMR